MPTKTDVFDYVGASVIMALFGVPAMWAMTGFHPAGAVAGLVGGTMSACVLVRYSHKTSSPPRR